MGGQKLVADLAPAESLVQQVAQGEKIAQLLGHLLAVHHQVGAVQPGVDELMAGGRLALGDFVVVVREDIVHPAGVQVEGLAQILHAHGRALDVPARPAAAPRGVPPHVAILLIPGLPQGEVGHVVLLVFVLGHPGARLHARFVQAGQAAVGREGIDPVVDRLVLGLIGMTLGHQGLNQGDHLRDVVGGRGIAVGRGDIQGLEVGEEGLDVGPGVVLQRLLLLQRAPDGFVIHIGQVHDLVHVVARKFQVAVHQVLEHIGPVVAHVGEVVNGGPAGVEADAPGLDGLERLQAAGQGIEEVYAHG